MDYVRIKPSQTTPKLLDSSRLMLTPLRFDMFDTNDDGLLSALEVEQLVEHALREDLTRFGVSMNHDTYHDTLRKRRDM